MRFLGLLITLALLGYLAYQQLARLGAAPGTPPEATAPLRAGSPSTPAAAPGVSALERARRVETLNQQRTREVDDVLRQGLSR
jgi:hypothetical protein